MSLSFKRSRFTMTLWFLLVGRLQIFPTIHFSNNSNGWPSMIISFAQDGCHICANKQVRWIVYTRFTYTNEWVLIWMAHVDRRVCYIRLTYIDRWVFTFDVIVQVGYSQCIKWGPRQAVQDLPNNEHTIKSGILPWAIATVRGIPWKRTKNILICRGFHVC